VPSDDEITGYRFERIGDVFPADDPLARYLVVVSMALNDVTWATKRLLEGLEGDAPPYENVYALRLAGSHMWEMLKFLSGSEKNSPEVAAFLDGLPEDAREYYRSALARLEADPKDGARPFKASLARLRDQFSHYTDLDRKELMCALEAVGDDEGLLHVGERFGDFRALYADEVAGQLAYRSEDDQLVDLEAFVTKIRNATNDLMRFGQLALREYLRPIAGDKLTPVTAELPPAPDADPDPGDDAEPSPSAS